MAAPLAKPAGLARYIVPGAPGRPLAIPPAIAEREGLQIDPSYAASLPPSPFGLNAPAAPAAPAPSKPFDQVIAESLGTQKAAPPAAPLKSASLSDLGKPGGARIMSDAEVAERKAAEEAAKSSATVQFGGAPAQRGPARGGGSIRVPGGPRLQTFIRQPGVDLPDGLREDLEAQAQRLDYRAKDTEMRGEIRAQDMELERIRGQRLVNQEKDALDQEKAKRTAIDTRIHGLQRIADQRTAEAEATKPQTFQEIYDNRDTFSKISSALSMAAYGYVSGVKGGENQGHKMLMDSLKAEMQSQRDKWERANAIGQQAKNDFSEAVQIYGTPEAAEADLASRYLANAAAQAQNLASKSQQDDVRQAHLEKAEELRGMSLEARKQLYTATHAQTVQENWANIPDQYISTGPRKPKKDELERRVRLPDGSYGYATDATTKRGVQDKITSLGDLNEILGRARTFADEGAMLTPDERAAQWESLKSQAAIAIAVAGGQGAISEGDAKRYDAILGGDWNALGRNSARIDEAIKTNQGKLHSQIRDNVSRDPEGSEPVVGGGRFDERPE